LAGLRPSSGPITEPVIDVDHMTRITQTIRPPHRHE
jgi:hypothetical protein